MSVRGSASDVVHKSKSMGRLRYYIKPGEVRQLLYKITSKEETPVRVVLFMQEEAA